MGNIEGTYFKQPAWDSRRPVRARRLRARARPGGSADRHARHTIPLDLKSHVHFEKEAFFQYDRVFERTRSQGALTGYAHLGELFNGRRGLALDVPFAWSISSKFCRGGRLNTDVWYSFPSTSAQSVGRSAVRTSVLRTDAGRRRAHLREARWAEQYFQRRRLVRRFSATARLR